MAVAQAPQATYDPHTHQVLSFHDAIPRFCDGRDTPRAYLERCLETIAARELTIQAFACLNLAGARAAADASDRRYKAARPLSLVDGMPFGVKDLYETVDMPTQLNSPIYADWQGLRDSAHVYALRRGGAVIVGKTTTTEFGAAAPPPTRNPFDPSRTAGGSSSGSSAAVGARMLPAASGSQVRGSIVRPAGYCANYALKPTFGALNRGGGHSLSPSQSVLGVHAGTLEDCWRTAFYISSVAGGDPGYPGLFGHPTLGAAKKPVRLIRLDSRGWDDTTEATREAFERFLAQLAHAGINILSRRDDPRIEAFEQALYRIPDFMFALLDYEARWPLGDYQDHFPGQLSVALQQRLERSRAMTLDTYRDLLAQRAALRAQYAALQDIADACVLLCSQDPPPLAPFIGNPVYGDVSSCLGAPAFSLPLLAVEGLPVGLQYMGWPDGDYDIACQSRWLVETFKTRSD
jgi:Asp-tRNA(Asn)/Glu-tRNA(Gln) amidotransferase A subunit family amidase